MTDEKVNHYIKMNIRYIYMNTLVMVISFMLGSLFGRHVFKPIPSQEEPRKKTDKFRMHIRDVSYFIGRKVTTEDDIICDLFEKPVKTIFMHHTDIMYMIVYQLSTMYFYVYKEIEHNLDYEESCVDIENVVDCYDSYGVACDSFNDILSDFPHPDLDLRIIDAWYSFINREYGQKVFDSYINHLREKQTSM